MPPLPSQPPPTATTPGKGRGFLVALLVVGGVLVLTCLVGGLGLWRASKTDAGQRALSALGESVRLAAKGAAAPGTQALKEAGCTSAMVATPEDVEAMRGTMQTMLAALDAGPAGQAPGVPWVSCTALVGAPPGCDNLAEVYAAAAQPAGDFLVTVRTNAEPTPHCRGRYSAEGKPKTRW